MRLQSLSIGLVFLIVCAETVKCDVDLASDGASMATSYSQHRIGRKRQNVFFLGKKAAARDEAEPVYSGSFTSCDGTSSTGTTPYNKETYWKVTLKEGERVEIEVNRISCGMFPTLSLHLGTDLTNLPAPVSQGTNSIDIPSQCKAEYPDDLDPKLVVDSIPSTGDYTIRILGAGDQPTVGSDFDYKVNVRSSDSDADGVGDACDMCPSTDLGESIKVLQSDSGVANAMVGEGCSVNDLMPSTIDSCAEFARLQTASLNPAKLHFRKCMSEELAEWKDGGILSPGERQDIMKSVRQVQHNAVVGVQTCNGGGERPTRLTCSWSPTKQSKCKELIRARLPYSYANKSPDCPRSGHRWIFFGDSTMLRMVRLTEMIEFLARHARRRIKLQCPDKYVCEHRKTGRHMYNEHFEIPYRPNLAWTPPDWVNNAEGPLRDVPNRPYCHDCGGCRSESLICQDVLPKQTCEGLEEPITYGGLYAVEFARDVEMQGPEYITTQENVALFLNRTYSPPPLVKALGRPVCVVNTGTHDALIPGITTAKFLKNLEWYLRLLDPHCEYMIYLATIAPDGERFPGHFDQVYEWNLGIKKILRKRTFRHKSTFINVFNTSNTFAHTDEVHMVPEWYEAFADFFMSIIRD